MKKTILTVLFVAFYVSMVSGQESESILSAPDNWNSEIMTFPLGFAPEIDFVGIEDIRFAPGWSDSTSNEFWTYHFTWFIEQTKPMTKDFLEKTLKVYYDGLMKVVESQSESTNVKSVKHETKCAFSKTNGGFTGEIQVYDAFFTKHIISLKAKVKQSFCRESGKRLISFNISPQDYENEVWGLFELVQITKNCGG